MCSTQSSSSEILEIRSSHVLLKISQCFYFTNLQAASPHQSLQDLAPGYFFDLITHFSHPLLLPLFLLFSLNLPSMFLPLSLCIHCPIFLEYSSSKSHYPPHVILRFAQMLHCLGGFFSPLYLKRLSSTPNTLSYPNFFFFRELITSSIY